MKKIPLKIKYNQLTELIVAIHQNKDIISNETITDKANNYILLDAFKKLLNAQIKKGESPSVKKPFTISLKYPEAAVLWDTLGTLYYANDYRKNVIMLISDQLHQKLL